MCSTALCFQSSGSNEGENMDAPLQDCTIEEQRGVLRFLWTEGVNLWKFTVICWLCMDRARWVNERFMSRWKGLNRVEHVLRMKVVLVGHQHRAHKTTRTAESFFSAEIQTLVERFNKCIMLQGDYVEKWYVKLLTVTSIKAVKCILPLLFYSLSY